MATEAEIAQSVQDQLAHTEYACSSLQRLNGGTANFVYRGKLKSAPRGMAIEDSTVIVKHTKDYIALYRDFKLDSKRCVFEESMLRALNGFSYTHDTNHAQPITVQAPRLYHFDSASNTQIMENLPDSVDLKTWLLSEEGGKSVSERAAKDIGRALGSWLESLHAWGVQEQQSALRETVSRNKLMQGIKHVFNYQQLVKMVDKHPGILESAREVFKQVEAYAATESTPPSPSGINESDWGLIHGDFWTGNVLICGSDLFVVDWEMGQLGPYALDLGQMLAEIFEAKHFRDVEAAMWVMHGIIENYASLHRDLAFRTAMHMGVHLVCWSSVPGWGTQEQVEDAIRVGRDMIVKAWQRDEDWFLQGRILKPMFGRED